MGLAATCGPSGNDDCCKSLLVPGGTFYRSYDGVDYLDKSYPATVSDFYLDKYEITVGRFRVFVDAGMGTQKSPPGDGAGAHPQIAGSGWNSTWNTNLPANTAALKAALKCYAAYQTWTDTPGSNEEQAGELPGLVHGVRVLRVGRGTAGDRGGVELRGRWGQRAAVLSVVEPANLHDDR